MKKITILGTMLLAAALIFTGCKENDDATSVSFDDCTVEVTNVNEIEFTPGYWTITEKMSSDEISIDATVKAKVAEDKTITFTSGHAKMTMDLAAQMGEENAKAMIDAYNNASADEKKAMLEGMGNIPEGASISFSGTKMTVSAPLGTDELADMKGEMDLSDLPANATVTTNSKNTKFVITIPATNNSPKQVIYVSKD